ncbi:MAG: methyltransferase domain-containing protein [Proteobacteria bacterium]|nr:methyltransferase domain-containing protein [Pseudomonadota bacterium]
MKTESYLVSTTGVFRRLARTLPRPADVVLEVGASFGLATEVLARSAAQVICIDHSKEMVAALRAKFMDSKNIEILWHDGRDIHGLLKKVPKIDVLFFDMGGDAPAHTALYVIQLYMNAYQPRVAVIRNISLAGMLGDVRLTEFPDETNYQRYREIPEQQQILEHYARENRRSGAKFAEREKRFDAVKRTLA